MALKAWALTTVARTKAYLGLDTTTAAEDTLLENYINIVTEYIERTIGFRIKLSTYTSEEYDTDRADALVLKHHPIVGTITIERRTSGLNEDDWETVDSQYYHVDENAGIIYGAGGYIFGQARGGFRVTYQAGYSFDNTTTFLSDTTGGDLELAAWILIGELWFDRAAGIEGGEIEREQIGDYSVTYARVGGAASNNLSVLNILDQYALPAVGGVQTPYVF